MTPDLRGQCFATELRPLSFLKDLLKTVPRTLISFNCIMILLSQLQQMIFIFIRKIRLVTELCATENDSTTSMRRKHSLIFIHS